MAIGGAVAGAILPMMLAVFRFLSMMLRELARTDVAAIQADPVHALVGTIGGMVLLLAVELMLGYAMMPFGYFAAILGACLWAICGVPLAVLLQLRVFAKWLRPFVVIMGALLGIAVMSLLEHGVLVYSMGETFKSDWIVIPGAAFDVAGAAVCGAIGGLIGGWRLRRKLRDVNQSTPSPVSS